MMMGGNPAHLFNIPIFIGILVVTCLSLISLYGRRFFQFLKASWLSPFIPPNPNPLYSKIASDGIIYSMATACIFALLQTVSVFHICDQGLAAIHNAVVISMFTLIYGIIPSLIFFASIENAHLYSKEAPNHRNRTLALTLLISTLAIIFTAIYKLENTLFCIKHHP